MPIRRSGRLAAQASSTHSSGNNHEETQGVSGGKSFQAPDPPLSESI